MSLTDKQKEKVHIFDNEKIEGIQLLVKEGLVKHIPLDKSADYYEGYYDAVEKVATLGLEMTKTLPGASLDHILAALPFLAMGAVEHLAKLDEEVKGDEWPSEVPELVM